MAGAVVKYSELVVNDGGFDKLIEDFKKLSKVLVKEAEALKKVINATKASSEELARHADETEKILKLKKQVAAAELKATNAKIKANKVTKQKAKLTEYGKEQDRQATAQAKLYAKVQLQTVGTLGRLRAELNLTNHLLAKNGVVFDKNGKALGTYDKKTQQLIATQKRLNSAVGGFEKKGGDFRRNVGNYQTGFAKLKNSIVSVTQAAGVFFGIMGAVRVIRNYVNIIREFDKSMATLSAVLQVSRDDIQAVNDEAIRLGEITVKTANEVGALSIAYARLGFSQQEILNLMEDTINGSIAMNAELDETAKLTGAMVKTFDEFNTTNAGEILDTMSLATAKSALNFEKLQKALPIVAGAANAAGLSFTRTTALLGKLSDAGIDVSTSATALRNILILSAGTGKSYEEILIQISESSDKLTASVDRFGRRAAVSSTVLSGLIPEILEFDFALTLAAGTSGEMAEKELATLDGAIKLVNSAWQGWVLRGNEANNITGTLRHGLAFLAKHLSLLLDIIVNLTIAAAHYVAVQGAMVLWTKAQILWTSILEIRMIAANVGIKKAITGMKLFNKVSKANVYAAIAAGIYLMVQAWIAFSKQMDVVEEVTKRTTDALKDQFKRLADLARELHDAKLGSDEQKEAAEKLNEEFGISIDLTKTYTEQTQDLNQAVKDVQDSMSKTQQIEEMNKLLDEFIIKRNILLEKADVVESGVKGVTFSVTDAKNLQIYNKEIDELTENIKNAKADEKSSAAEKINVKTEEEIAAAIAYKSDEAKAYIKLQELTAKNEKEDISALNKRTGAALEGLIDFSKQKAVVLAQHEIELNEIKQKYADIEEDRQKKAHDDWVKRRKIEIAAEKKRSAELRDDNQRSQIAVAKLNVLNATDPGEKIDALRELHDVEMKFFKGNDEERKLAQEQFDREDNERYQELVYSQDVVFQDGLDRMLEKQKEHLERMKKLKDDELKAEEEREKKRRKEFDLSFKYVSKGVQRLADTRVKIADDSVEAAQHAVEIQNQRAVAGLENSLALQQKLLLDAEKERADAVKRQQRVEKARALYSAYSGYARSDPSTAIANTLKDFAILEAITAVFKDGGIVDENKEVQKSGILNGPSHNSRSKGIHILAEGREGILSVNAMNNLGRENFNTIMHMAEKGAVDSDIFSKQLVQHTAVMEPGLKDEMVKTRKAIEKKAEVSVPEVINGMIQITSSSKRGNTTKRNIYRIHKDRF